MQAAALARQQLERAAVGARHALDDGKAEPRAAAARALEPRERALEPLGLAFGDARSAIAHLDDRLPASVPGLDLVTGPALKTTVLLRRA